MEARKKKRTFQFVEGHKRETRKSYQSFIEKTDPVKSSDTGSNDFYESGGEETRTGAWPKSVSSDKNKNILFSESIESDLEDMAERVRKSSRTPVPKKNFELIDKFDQRKVNEQNAGLTEGDGKDLEASEDLTPKLIVNIKKEQPDSDSDTYSRKSHRTPVPKKTFDLIDTGYKQHGIARQLSAGSETTDCTPQKKQLEKQVQDAEKAISKSSDKQPKKSERKGGKKSTNKSNESDKALPQVKKSTAKSKTEKTSSVTKKDVAAKAKENVAVILAEGVAANQPQEKKKKKKTESKKRKHEETSVSCDQEPEEDTPRTKIQKNQNENLDELVLMEALQALKQEPQEELEESEMQGDMDLAAKEKKGRRSTSKMLAAKSLHKTVRVKNAEESTERYVQIKQEKADSDENEFTFEKPEPQNFDCSTSVTERSDGHIILKLGGLNSPTKKKHKKKHKHHHRHSQEHHEKVGHDDGTQNDAEIVSESIGIQASFEPPLSEYDNVRNFTNPILAKVVKSGDKKHKKNKNRKRKRSMSTDEKVVEDAPPAKQEFVVKKRKIYKKKKGEKILVRIQTEYYSKSGELVKVEPVDVKDGSANPTKDKSKKLVKAAVKNAAKSKKIHAKANAERPMGLSSNSIVPASNPLKHKALSEKPRHAITGANHANKPKAANISIIKKKKPKAKPLKDDGLTPGSSPIKKKKEKKRQTLTAYLLYCRKYRPRVVADHPDMGFSEISKQLAKMWGEASEKEKYIYKKQLEEHRAKVNLTRRKQTTKLKTTKQNGSDSPDKDVMDLPNASKKSSKDYQIAPQIYCVTNLEPIDMAAHLQLLGESLTLVATALKRQGNMKVHGALSVLLDSCVCAMAPLMFLTSTIPEIDVIPADTKANILDNVAYILPGL